jgi:four helix bundle protein
MVESYRDLQVWQKGMQMAADCYRLTKLFPSDERFGMTTQIRRSACSIPANIAEGYVRESRGDYIHVLRISQGPLKERETHLLLGAKVEITRTETTPLLKHYDELGKMLHAMIRSLQTKNQTTTP